ncbi:hypothetical protein [Halobacillus sp. Nhm2S1]|uniref:hypothetical protein n=1 Tax=Halobacillus sp. Nhm2S1 TaxID=2866716 RepID=UPI00351CE934
MNHIRWGIIGCGNVTEVKSGPAFQKVDHSSLVAVMRRNGKRRKIMPNAMGYRNGMIKRKI